MDVYGILNGRLASSGKLSGSLASQQTMSGNLTIPTAILPPSYEGDYEFTPSEEAQTITIEGRTASQDIVIQPIPSNYGLITWDGRTLTVS